MGILKSILLLFLISIFYCQASLINKGDSTSSPTSSSSSCDDVATAFLNAKISPDYVPKPPNKLLQVTSLGGQVHLGNKMTPDYFLVPPTITYDPEPNTYYTFFMVDLNAVYPEVLPTPGTLIHWGVGNIQGNDFNTGTAFAPYVPVATPPLSSPHRYVQLLYKQQGLENYGLSALLSTTAERVTFNLEKFVTAHNLGNPISGNYFSGYPPEAKLGIP